MHDALRNESLSVRRLKSQKPEIMTYKSSKNSSDLGKQKVLDKVSTFSCLISFSTAILTEVSQRLGIYKFFQRYDTLKTFVHLLKEG